MPKVDKMCNFFQIESVWVNVGQSESNGSKLVHIAEYFNNIILICNLSLKLGDWEDITTCRLNQPRRRHLSGNSEGLRK